ncbi:putative gamma-taxilin 2 isoform X1 [Neofelis nebulosa]|uniref:putative gamma-taxilin 2 isoform X1 n=1 Tax=Neofelis nebulosa TaxID=61452 RepID=UPI00272BAF7E|nr:putative gamma-taxilin 2 isoform X1 [Neofelis nebulosa]XP_058571041.1 putative gamma-taxilin 2 isoform X1 [Neofelis nebulosa]XP_058571042.1 putative gamma-taxilin 2 isoform X1 [Neofelis nebulosa]
MDESRICRLGVKADRLCDSQSNDTLQHQDSNFARASSRHSLQEDEDSNCVRKNRNLVNPVYCTQESRMEPPGPDGGRDPSDDQQDSQCNRNKGKTLGKEVLLLMQALNTLSTPEEKLAALCKTYADLLKSMKQIRLVLEMMMKSSLMILEMTMKTLMISKLNVVSEDCSTIWILAITPVKRRLKHHLV